MMRKPRLCRIGFLKGQFDCESKKIFLGNCPSLKLPFNIPTNPMIPND